MASTFSLLTAGGARFDRYKYRHDIDLFNAPHRSKSKGRLNDIHQSPIALLSSLDLFHSHTTEKPTGATKSKPSKRKRSAQAETDDESDSSSFSSSSKPLPAPPKQKITLTGSSPLPKSIHSNLPSLLNHESALTSSRAGAPLLSALQAAGIHSLWGVQCAVAGCLLEGRDTICVAPTGSGKTLAYVLPTIVKLGDPARNLRGKDKGVGVRSVVLVPTHDLAVQILSVVRAVTRGRAWRSLILTKATEKAVCECSPGNHGISGMQDKKDMADAGYGGRDQSDGEVDDNEDEDDEDEAVDAATGHAMSANHGGVPLGIDILIATPERLHHLIESGRLSLASTRYLILDESDRLLSPDFLPQVEPIILACFHKAIQRCFLSATMPSGAEEIANRWLRDSRVRVVVGVKDSAVTTVDQSLLYTGSESGKVLALRNLISSGQLPYPSLIFVQSVARATDLHRSLVMDDVRVDVVHGNKGKAKRDEAIKAFREGSVWMLVVTEVLARGMDFRGVKVVVNYDFPQSVQSYVHRIGRTGRAGRPGKAITFFSNEDQPHLRTIGNVLRSSGCPVPQYMLDLPKPSKNLKRKVARVPVKRKEVGGGGRDVGKEVGRRRKEMVEGSQRRRSKVPID